MRKLTVAAFISLDGVIQAPGGPEEDPSEHFTHGGWVVPFDDDTDEVMGGAFDQPFELLLGRRTYDIFAGYWPQVPADAPHYPIAEMLNGARKHVATHHPETVTWQNSQALGADTMAALRALKQSPGPDLLTQGSSDLVRQLLATDLVDNLLLLVFPVLLGRGKRLYDDHTQAAGFRLVATKTSPTGVLVNRYARVGEVRTGTFG